MSMETEPVENVADECGEMTERIKLEYNVDPLIKCEVVDDYEEGVHEHEEGDEMHDGDLGIILKEELPDNTS